MRNIACGETIQLKADNNIISFVIENVLKPLGGSCVAYEVSYFENGDIPHRGILKEYCPAFLEGDEFSREGTAINIPDDKKDLFEEGLSDFKNSYKHINEYLSDNLFAVNYHTIQLGLYEGNNTAYTLTSCDYGVTYEKVDDDSLLSICKIALSVTKAVELYHKAGFLHLDIKPKNILILDGVTDLVKLFDFDSLTSIEKLKKREVLLIPAPEDYTVPDLESYDLRDIDIRTDIFEIGAMIFLKMFKRAPDVADISFDAKYDFDGNELFNGISPQAKSEIADLFKKTVQITKILRFKTTDELKEKLEKIISLLNEDEPYLVDLPKWQPSKYFVGRKDELKEIKKRLDTDGYVFIKGVGGLGKSEIAKLYAKQYADEYHTVQFWKYTDSLQSLVESMPVKGINDVDYKNADELTKAKNKALHLSDKKTLIIVDNFNVTYDEFLRDFLPHDSESFKVIFTTRCEMAAEYYESKMYRLPKLSLSDCKTLFFWHCQQEASVENEENAQELIEFIDYNTLIIVLAAITVKKTGLSIGEMLEKLKEQEISDIDTEIFHEYDFSSEEVSMYNKINSHLMTIFSVSNLDDVQKEILKDATLISPGGMSLDAFIENCKSENINEQSVGDLVSLGWINKDSNNVISMHPIVSDLLAVNKNLVVADSYEYLIDHLEDIGDTEYSHFSFTLAKLEGIKHLYRRYKFESKAKQMTACIKLGRMYKFVYRPNEARKYFKEALKTVDDVSPNETLRSYGEVVEFSGEIKTIFIGTTYYALGDVEKEFGTMNKTIEYYQKAIDILEEQGQDLYSLVIEALVFIGESYCKNQQFLQAYEKHLEALNYAKRYGEKEYGELEYIPKVAKKLVKICEKLFWDDKAEIYQRVYDAYKRYDVKEIQYAEWHEYFGKTDSGDFQGAIEIAEKEIAEIRDTLGEDSPIYRSTNTSLWYLQFLSGNEEEGFRLLNENMAFVEETSGTDSPDMAELLVNAAEFMLIINRYDDMTKFVLKAIEICEKGEFTNEYVYVKAVFVLVKLYSFQGKLKEAKELVKKINFSDFSGPESLSNFIASIGLVMFKLGEYDEIVPMCEKMLKIGSDEDEGFYCAHIVLSEFCVVNGNIDKAFEYISVARRIVENHKKMFKDKQHFIAPYYKIYSDLYCAKCEYKKAIQVLTEFLDGLSNSEKENVFVAALFATRALMYYFDKDYENAKKDNDTAHKIYTNCNIYDEAYLTVLNVDMLLYIEAEDYVGAKEVFDEIYQLKPNIEDPVSIEEATLCSNMGFAELNLGNAEKAIGVLKKSLAVYERMDLCKIDAYFKIKKTLALAYANQKDFDTALTLLGEIRRAYKKYNLVPSSEVALHTNYYMLTCLFEAEKSDVALEFANVERINFKKWFGESSPVTVSMLLQTGCILRGYGLWECYDYIFRAKDLIDETQDYDSQNNASLLNFLGCYEGDELDHHHQALIYFDRSRKLFEKLGKTNSELYKTVLGNIKHEEEIIIKNLMNDE